MVEQLPLREDVCGVLPAAACAVEFELDEAKLIEELKLNHHLLVIGVVVLFENKHVPNQLAPEQVLVGQHCYHKHYLRNCTEETSKLGEQLDDGKDVSVVFLGGAR